VIEIAALAACAMAMTACNRPSDQGGTGPSTTTESRQESGSQSRVNEPSRTPLPPAATMRDSTPPSKPEQTVAKPPDNTGKNVRDRSDAAVTPGDQSEAKSDLELTRSIRRAITENSQFSTTAKNIKVITTANGKVILRGPVNTPAEKDQIAQLVQSTAGVTAVDNELEVKTNP